jgi:hypothetical protein
MLLVVEKRTLNSLHSDCRSKNKRTIFIKKIAKMDNYVSKSYFGENTYKLFFWYRVESNLKVENSKVKKLLRIKIIKMALT